MLDNHPKRFSTTGSSFGNECYASDIWFQFFRARGVPPESQVLVEDKVPR